MPALGQLIHRTVHTLYTHDVSSRSTQHTGRLLIVIWMQSHSGCELFFPIDSDTGPIMVPTGLRVLKPSGNGFYLMPHQPKLPPTPLADSSPSAGARFALTAHCDPILWHRRFGHLNMQILEAQHTHGVPTSPALAISVTNVSCDSCLLHMPSDAPRNTAPCTKPFRPLLNLSSNI
jgi:hypothetical protein